MFCGKCGVKQVDAASFCSSCGAALMQKTTKPDADAQASSVRPVIEGNQPARAEPVSQKGNEGCRKLVSRDSRFGQVKVFDKAIMTAIAISENGYIGIYQPGGRRRMPGLIAGFEDVPEELTVLHISSIHERDLIVDNKSGIGAAIVGGLLFDGAGAIIGQRISSGKAKSIDLQLKTTDFNNPQVVIPLYRAETVESVALGSFGPWNAIGRSLAGAVKGTGQQRKEEIQELMSQLDNLLLKNQASNTAAPAVQQMSEADELIKFKSIYSAPPFRRYVCIP